MSTAAIARRARRSGAWLIAAAVLAAPLVIGFSAPPFHTGIWYKTEPVIAGLFAVAAAAALGLGLAAAGGSRLARGALAHPLALLPLALAIWSALALPWLAMPGLSWLGTPELGQGIAWHLATAVLVAAGLWAMRARRLRRALGAVVVAAVAVATAAMLPGAYERDWGPFLFADSLAFYGLFATPLLIATLAGKRVGWRLAALAFGVAVIVVSGNRSAILLAVAAVPLTGLALWLNHRPRRLRLAAAASAALAPLAVTAMVLIAGPLLPESSLWSRSLHLEVVGRALGESPALLLAGGGWGHYGEWQIAHLPLDRIDLTTSSAGEGIANWDAVHGQMHFQSHNFLAEAVLSAGLPGMLLAWALPVMLPLVARRRHLVEAAVLAVVVAALLAVWAPDAGALALLALALAALAGRLPRRRPPPAVAVVVALPVAALLAAAALATLRDAGPAWDAAMANRAAEVPAMVAEDDCAGALTDHRRGGIHLATLYRSYAIDLADRIAAGQALGPAAVARLENYICAAEARLGDGGSLRLATADLLVTGELVVALDDPALAALKAAQGASWGTRLMGFLRRAPGREDMATAYLGWAFARGDERAMAEVAARLLAHDTDSPVGLWFSGAALMAAPETAAAGFARMRRALSLGLEKRMPVDAGLAERIRAAPVVE